MNLLIVVNIYILNESGFKHKGMRCCISFFVSVKPLTARIHATKTPLVADMTYDIVCDSAGSRPPAVVTWYKNNHRLKKVKVRVYITF